MDKIARLATHITRRSFLAGALGASLSLLVPSRARTAADITNTPAKSGMRMSLADFGGVPGKAPAALIDAFQKAFSGLKESGGGTLIVPPGDYDFGSYASSKPIVAVSDLRNVSISAYGARFLVTSKTNATPGLFCFTDVNNVALSGASFTDPGLDTTAWLTHKRQGMYCVVLRATSACGDFRLKDCSAANVTGLYVHDGRSNKYKLRNVIVEDCKVTNAYYGVDAIYQGDNLSVRNLVCRDVRRGFISFGARNMDVDVKLNCDAHFLGSNGFIVLVCEGASEGNVENLNIRLTASGVESHMSLIHFSHQQKDSPGSISNVNANVRLENLTPVGKDTRLGKLNVFLFDHELPSTEILRETTRTWDRIALSGEIIGRVSGDVVSCKSVPRTPGTLTVDDRLAAFVNLPALAGRFKVQRLSQGQSHQTIPRPPKR